MFFLRLYRYENVTPRNCFTRFSTKVSASRVKGRGRELKRKLCSDTFTADGDAVRAYASRGTSADVGQFVMRLFRRLRLPPTTVIPETANEISCVTFCTVNGILRLLQRFIFRTVARNGRTAVYPYGVVATGNERKQYSRRHSRDID